jgi:NADPH:quinone reductase-like Zn-dependent oxidoreductase
LKAYELVPGADLEGLQLSDRPSAALGPRDVRVKVHAVSLNYRDLNIAKNVKRKKAVIPCSDGAGEVLEAGSEVKRLKIGDRVAANFFPTWNDGAFNESHHANALGGTIDGMLAQEVVLAEPAWVKLPDRLSYEEAASLPCAAVTAWNALFEAHSLKPGETVLVQGSGGVSVFALQLAKAAGAKVIATSSSAEKRERLKSMGADELLDYKATPEWGKAVDGRADVVVEVGGAGTFDQSVKALRYNGTMSLIGVLAGIAAPISTYALIHKAIRVHGLYVGSVRMF